MADADISSGLLSEPEFGDDTSATRPAETADQFIARVTGSANLAADMARDEAGKARLVEIAQQALQDYDLDKSTMSKWLEQMEAGLALAQLVKEDKQKPFKGCANVLYPLVTSAALQFNARAYPAIVPEDRAVKAKVWGNDPAGQKAARADRVSEFMSWQLSAQIEEWEPETDKLLTLLPIVGTMVRKWWLDPIEGRARCRLIEPGKFIVNNAVRNLRDAPRVTEELPLYPTEIESRIRSGQFIEFEFDPGVDKLAAQNFIEQHTRIDLDGDDYPEPYVVTVHRDTQKVVRIVADFTPADVRWETETEVTPQTQVVTNPETGLSTLVYGVVTTERHVGILSITRGSHFVAHRFMPGMDGGFHGTGLGLLLGDISEAINGIINMLLDAGHFASLGGGFLGAEMRMRGGALRFEPGEWKTVSTFGNDVRSSMVPITYPGPDATLFQLLGLLIEAGREIASVKDVITGDVQRQQTATTTLALIEQGMMVFTAAYKRIFGALKREYKLLAGINAQSVSLEEYNQFHDGDQQFDPRADFGAADMDVEPVADPRSVTKMQEASKAQLVMQLAERGLVDPAEALARVAQAADIPDVERLLPKPDPMQQQMQQQMAAMQMASAEAALMQARADVELTLAKIEGERASAVKDLADAEAKGIGQRLDAMKMALEERRARLDHLLRGAERMAAIADDAANARSHAPEFGEPPKDDRRLVLVGSAGAGGGSQGGPVDGATGEGLL